MYNLLQNEHFWVYICFFLFIAIFGKTCYVQFKKFLESQVEAVKATIDDSDNLLDNSLIHLKEQQDELHLLDQKISNLEARTKNSASNLSEIFFDNLALKEKFLQDSFKNYLSLEQSLNQNKLGKDLVNKSYDLTLQLLHNNLNEQQKTKLLNTAIANLPNNLKQLYPNG